MNPLKTLLITNNLPFPSFKGGDLRNWQNLNGLRGISQVGVFGLYSNGRRRENVPLPGLAFWRSWVDPALSYPPPQGQKLAARGWLLDPLGHPTDLYSDLAAAELARIVGEFKPQIAVVEGLWLHRYIPILKGYGCRIVLDSHNVEAKLCEQLGDDLPAKLVRKILLDRTRIIEHRATHAVDQIWVCSGIDARWMNKLYTPPASIHVVPNGVDVPSYEDVRTGRCSLPAGIAPTRHTLIFPATFSYAPNATAATFLIGKIFPQLARRFPDCQLLLVGILPTPLMLEAAKKDARIIVTGTVSNVRPYLAAASVMVVPLFEGSGTRFKILEAFAAGVPLVSTAKGAEGLAVRDGVHLLLAERADEFIDAIQRLWADDNLAKRLTGNGRKLVEQEYSWGVTGQRITQAINELDVRGG